MKIVMGKEESNRQTESESEQGGEERLVKRKKENVRNVSKRGGCNA